MKRTRLTLLALAVACSGCVSNPAGGEPSRVEAASGSAAASENAGKLDAAERQLAVARAKLDVARLERESYDQQQAEKMRQAQAELALAQARLARFVEADAPTRLASEGLDLKTARDRAQEAADELAQIEIMYDDQNLDDLTAEFVVSRGRRNADRTAARIAIQEALLSALEERELPQEKLRYELEVDKAAAALKATEREGEIGRRGKAIALQESENTIAKLELELAELREKPAGGSSAAPGAQR